MISMAAFGFAGAALTALLLSLILGGERGATAGVQINAPGVPGGSSTPE